MHLVSVVVERHRAFRVTAHADLVRLQRDDMPMLVEHLECLALNFEDDTGRLRVELDEVMEFVAANHIHTRADFRRLADVLGKHRHLLERQV